MESYPIICIDLNSRKTPINFTASELTAAGTVRAKNSQIDELFRFNISHSYVTQAEAESIYALWRLNKAANVLLYWLREDKYFVCKFESPPDVDLISGVHWYAKAQLIGTPQADEGVALLVTEDEKFLVV